MGTTDRYILSQCHLWYKCFTYKPSHTVFRVVHSQLAQPKAISRFAHTTASGIAILPTFA